MLGLFSYSIIIFSGDCVCRLTYARTSRSNKTIGNTENETGYILNALELIEMWVPNVH